MASSRVQNKQPWAKEFLSNQKPDLVMSTEEGASLLPWKSVVSAGWSSDIHETSTTEGRSNYESKFGPKCWVLSAPVDNISSRSKLIGQMTNCMLSVVTWVLMFSWSQNEQPQSIIYCTEVCIDSKLIAYIF